MNRFLTHRLVNRPLTRLVRPAARFISTDVLWNLPVVGNVEVRPEGWSGAPVLMANDGTDRVASMLFWRGAGGWEPETVKAFLELVVPESTVVDVGAHTGLFSLLAAHVHPSVRVHALEPLPRAFSLLESNVVLNGLANVDCRRAACGAFTGKTSLHVPADRGLTMMASLDPAWSESAETTDVDCVTLDRLVEMTGAERVDVVKIDAEGSEAAVLDGGARTLSEHRPFVLCEVLDRAGLGERITATLGDANYRFFALGPGGPRPCAEVMGGIDADETHNYLCAHESRLAALTPLMN
jgi:FkbM family methyltransferase